MADEIVAELEWRDIPGWPGYRVSSCGVVQTCKRTGYGNTLTSVWKTMKQRDDKRGYRSLGLKNVEKRTWIPVHVLVLMSFVGPRPNGMQGCHNNGNKHDNRLENLRWDTPKANAQDAIEHGTWIHGEKYGAAKLTDRLVTWFLAEVMKGRAISAIAKEAGINKATLYNVIYGAWGHVPRPDGFDAFRAGAAKRGNESRRIRKNMQCRQCNQTFSMTPAQLRQRSGKYCSRNCYLSRNRTGAETAHTP